ncbi:MAG: Smr/MutS family protein [Deltaproteobacteria bacterium]|nr:Smr/MutS family protein [Deltaproteobacteria bacterium]
MIPEKTFHDLQWGRLVEAVASRCRGPLAQRLVVPLASSAEGARTALAETGEVMALLADDETVPLDGHRELGLELDRVSRGGALTAPTLRDVMKVLGAARSLRLFLGRRKESMPALHAACAIDPSLDVLHDELAAAIESDGTLADHASAELRRLRTETANLRARIVRRLETMLHEHSDILQDGFHTVREGRYVVPVRRDAHEKLEGIVHGTSASGATVFVEPRALVGQGNRLKMAQAELQAEEQRILVELTELVRERLASLRAAVAALDHADLRQAMARLGVDTHGVIVTVPDEPRADLAAARHPVLLLDGVDVVPGDLHLEGGAGMVLSGPNAGGKTVALKALGVAALATRAGIPFPADPGSACGFFEPILTDVGDEQSLTQNLSTFSAHVTNLKRVLDGAGPRALVLLDELAGGTDPVEGAALAGAVLAALLDRGAAVATTTHYAPVKAMAATDERLRNVAVGFDVSAMQPTFELHAGIPGASSALAVARRFGIPDAVIADAEHRLPDRGHAFEQLLAALEAERDALAKRVQELASREAAIAKGEASLEAQREKLKEEKQKVLDDEARELRREIRSTRKALKTARTELRAQAEADKIAEARGLLEEAQEVEKGAPKAKLVIDDEGRASLSEVNVGDRVYVPHMRAEAEVLEVKEEKDETKVRLAAGALKLWAELSKLRAADAPKAPTGRKPPAPEPEPQRAVQTSDNTLDIRGMRVDDALAMTESFLDRMYGADEPAAYIVHGVGTGALRDAIRERLERDQSYVASFRKGTREEGGDRLTVVELR